MGKFFGKLGDGFRRLMKGRYGSDKLNTAILVVGLVTSLLQLFMPTYGLKWACMLISYGFLFWAMFRMFSRNVYKRYEENRKYLRFLDKLKDKEHRYFDCPRCRQSVRVPKGKGKIAITCPKCKEKFIKKT